VPAPESYIWIRRIAVQCDLEIKTLDSFALIVGKLFSKAFGLDFNAALASADLTQWAQLRKALRENLQATPVKSEEASEAKFGEEPVSKAEQTKPLEPGEKIAKKSSLVFSSQWIEIENSWQGIFLHAFLMSSGSVALQFGYVPLHVVNFGLKAFDVTKPPNPEKTLQVLLDKALCVPTLVFILWIVTKTYDDTLWNKSETELMTLLLPHAGGPLIQSKEEPQKVQEEEKTD
jgi:hypothetical protein